MSVLYVRDKDGRLIPVGSKAAPPDLSDYVRSVNGVEPDENGNVEITIPDSGGNVENGEDGFSPIAKVEQTTTGAVISITDKDGTTTATITNGKDGKDGVDGQDGYTPQKDIDYFDGKDGQPGKDGADGYTPIRGTDYYTEADKTEMVNAVLSALPTWTGGSY